MNIKQEEATRQITSALRQLNLEAVTHVQRERFLRSLKFPAMNERRNHIVKSYEGTFEWILRSRTATSDSTSNDDTSKPGETNDDNFSDSSNQPSGGPASYEQTSKTLLGPAGDIDGDDLWDNFGDWLRSESKLYWISGKPGSGKSTLVKFLIGSLLTREALEVWKPDTTILSHFFWKPGGSPMQRSIKGLLCSLFYQAISVDQGALNALLSSTPSLASKDADTDWSFEELMAESLRFFASLSRPFCIFIDGLDEVSDEDDEAGATALMKVIDEMKTLPYIKICVASRAEPRFEKLLCNTQRLRLQDLTAGDMRRFAAAKLSPYLHAQSTSPDLEHPMIYELADRADGVFLWLRLAIQSLIRGCEFRENGNILRQRLSVLPNELSQLYNDMWTRLNDDIPLYREPAARYFNLIIDAADLHDRILESKNDSTYSPYTSGNINIFQLMAATETIVPVTLLDQRGELEGSRLSQLCEATQTAIKLRCAGLVEIVTPNEQHFSVRGAAGWHEGSLPGALSSVRWIHRSAYDFLRDSEDGHKLRSHDGSSQDERIVLLMRAQLAQNSTFRDGSYSYIHEVLCPLSWVRNPVSREPVEEILRVCWDWYESNYMGIDNRATHLASPHFLAVLSGTQFRDFVLSSIENSSTPSKLATIVLRDMMYMDWFGEPLKLIDEPDVLDSFSDAVACFVKRLLALGADPSTKGFCRKRHPGHGASAFGPCMFASALGYFLIESLSWPPSFLSHALELLSTFMTTGPDLDEDVPLELVFDYSDIFLQYGECRSDAEDIRGNSAKIILYTNLACLIRLLFLRSSQGTGAQSSAVYSHMEERLKLTREGIPPYPSIRVAAMFLNLPNHGIRRYRPLNHMGSPNLLALLKLVELWLGGSDAEGLDGDMWEQLSRLKQEIVDGKEAFVAVNDPIEVYLAKEGYGYKFVE